MTIAVITAQLGTVPAEPVVLPTRAIPESDELGSDLTTSESEERAVRDRRREEALAPLWSIAPND